MIEVWNNAIQEREVQNFSSAVANRTIMEGPVLKEFEERIKKILKVDYVLGVSSGSAALALAMMGIGVRPGDEIIVPDMTFIATANAAHLLGADVIVAPVRNDRPLIDGNAIEDYITDKTKAIITVDLNGRVACSKMLREKYAPKGIYIIDDACQAFMSCDEEGRLAGTQADISCYSFGITKTLTTIKGGLVATNNKEIYDKMKVMKTQGMSSVFEGDAYLYPGFNFKLPDVLASIGLAQIERLDDKMEHMREIDRMYRAELADVKGIFFLDRKEGEHPWMTDIMCDNKDMVREILAKHDISSRPIGKPLHTAHFLISKGKYEFGDMMREKMLYLPSGPDQDIKNVEKVIRVLKSNNLNGVS